MSNKIIYKIVPRDLWAHAQKSGSFTGAPIDLADGYIHFSMAEQVRETAAKHFAGESDLLLVQVNTASLAPDLKFEVSRGGALFPHLYADLPLSAVVHVAPLALGDDGLHIFPELKDQ
ncbi:DUF952 domain-containing protein [Brucella sp. BE17]|uniref:DUF952 domain-containing protein n=1 Tax=Brucella sp. BE17 TaxID=3142977 RepID=UPI0031BB125E